MFREGAEPEALRLLFLLAGLPPIQLKPDWLKPFLLAGRSPLGAYSIRSGECFTADSQLHISNAWLQCLLAWLAFICMYTYMYTWWLTERSV